MENQKTETQEKAENPPNQVGGGEAGITIPKAKTTKSQLQKLMGFKFIKNRFKKEKSFFRKPAASVAKILNKIVKSNNRYRLISTRTCKGLFKQKHIAPQGKGSQKLLNRLDDIETIYGVELSVKKLSPKKYRCKVSKSISKCLPVRIKGNELRKLSRKKNAKAPSSLSSKVKCPIDEVDIEDITGYAEYPSNPLQNVLFNLRDKLYPTLIRYHYNDRREQLKKVLLVHVPNSLNAYQLSTLYGTKLTEAQTEFYGEDREKGAPEGGKLKTEVKMRRAARKLAMTIPGFASKERDEQFDAIKKETDMSKTYTIKFRRIIRDGIKEAVKIHTIWKEEKDSLLNMNADERCKFLAKRLRISREEFREEFLPFVEKMINSNHK